MQVQTNKHRSLRVHVWTQVEEEALRELVALLEDVGCTDGYAEEARMDDAGIWKSADFVGRRAHAQVLLRRQEVVGFFRYATLREETRGCGLYVHRFEAPQ
jgi:uncharacterized tellurite resistance protein B-like protein